MSHYAVAVFSDDGDFNRLLKPYNENDETYFTFHPVDYEKIVDDFERFKAQNPKWTLDMYINEWGYRQEGGQWGYRSNPCGYWDWYSLDGKDYMYELKDGVELPDGAWDYRKNDYEWYPNNRRDIKEAKEFWEEYIEQENDEDYPSLWSRDYYLERYKTKKQYVKEMSRTLPWAFITPDGEWHSAGTVGWFAASDETAEDADRYAKEWDAWIASEANPYVNLVDCHI